MYSIIEIWIRPSSLSWGIYYASMRERRENPSIIPLWWTQLRESLLDEYFRNVAQWAFVSLSWERKHSWTFSCHRRSQDHFYVVSVWEATFDFLESLFFRYFLRQKGNEEKHHSNGRLIPTQQLGDGCYFLLKRGARKEEVLKLSRIAIKLPPPSIQPLSIPP